MNRDPHITFTKHELVDVWPGKKNAYRCTFNQYTDLDKGLPTWEANVPKAECELQEFLYDHRNVLTESDMAKLKQLIEAYGDERYNKAGDEAAMDAAGEDI